MNIYVINLCVIIDSKATLFIRHYSYIRCIDDLEEFDTSLSKSMFVFGRYKNSEFYYDILNKIMDDKKHCVELLSLSSSADIKNNYQIISIYPKL